MAKNKSIEQTEEVQETVERVDKQEKIQDIKEINNTIKETYSLKELKALAYLRNVSIDNIIDLLVISKDDIQQIHNSLKKAKMLAETHQVTITEAIKYLKYQNNHKTQD